MVMRGTPTYPSEKYGFVLSVQDNSSSEYKKILGFMGNTIADVVKNLLVWSVYWNGVVWLIDLDV